MGLSSSSAVTHFPPCAHIPWGQGVGWGQLGTPTHTHLGLPLDGNSQDPCVLAALPTPTNYLDSVHLQSDLPTAKLHLCANTKGRRGCLATLGLPLMSGCPHMMYSFKEMM